MAQAPSGAGSPRTSCPDSAADRLPAGAGAGISAARPPWRTVNSCRTGSKAAVCQTSQSSTTAKREPSCRASGESTSRRHSAAFPGRLSGNRKPERNGPPPQTRTNASPAARAAVACSVWASISASSEGRSGQARRKRWLTICSSRTSRSRPRRKPSASIPSAQSRAKASSPDSKAISTARNHASGGGTSFGVNASMFRQASSAAGRSPWARAQAAISAQTAIRMDAGRRGSVSTCR